MKYNAHAVAEVLRSLAMRRAQGDGHSTGPRQPPAARQDPPVRILYEDDDQGFSEVGPDQPTNQQAYPDDAPKDAAWVYLLGIAIIVYLLALMFVLFG